MKAEPIVDENNNQVVTNDNAAAVGSENEEAPIYRLRLRSNQQNGEHLFGHLCLAFQQPYYFIDNSITMQIA